MTHTAKEVLDFVAENDVKFIRLAFCDLFGAQKNISIMPGELAYAFEKGIPFDASAIGGFSDFTKTDLILIPDPTTLNVLPWRPQQGRVVRFYCDIRHPNGVDFECDSRILLKRVVKRCADAGYVCNMGLECEFYLFKVDEQGEPTKTPFDNGGYFDISPTDKGENVRREICLCLEEMGIRPESSHHERGPGQNKINFKFSDALTSVDNLQTFKSVVKAIAGRNGLFASFMPKPILSKSPSGLHINLSLSQNGQNIFRVSPTEHSKTAESFIAGVLKRVPEMTLFLNPTANSYERLGAQNSSKYVSWSHQSRSQLVRIPAADGEKARMDLRSPDPSLNPYLAVSLIISAGLDGIQENLPLMPPLDTDIFSAPKNIISKLARLPSTFADAVALAEKSKFIPATLGSDISVRYIAAKSAESAEFSHAETKSGFYDEHYFKIL
ncbi:MAG: glutamine synthetase family protein [Clostridiales bacterium]|jgi:glutamine synthetase|nr:glutamine synthetase family protein [Clostridiales bacterium]